MKYFSYDPYVGIEFHDTAELAQSRARKSVDATEPISANPNCTWPENEHEICWGEVRGQCVITDRPLTNNEKADNPECSVIRSFALVDMEATS